jgi:hypothetical protein
VVLANVDSSFHYKVQIIAKPIASTNAKCAGEGSMAPTTPNLKPGSSVSTATLRQFDFAGVWAAWPHVFRCVNRNPDGDPSGSEKDRS